jgi:hypothetical protein
MPQVFRPSANTLIRVVIIGGVLLGGLGLWLTQAVTRSAYQTGVGVPREQPVPFSHKHHVAGIGIDCRYCHATVEIAASAGMPATDTCMGCHSQIWADAPMLEPVRASLRENRPLAWIRVHDLPDFTFFNHAIHVSKGIGCATCHGRVDQMPLLWQVNSLQMEWCLDCHRQPERYVRPRDQVFQMDYQAPANQLELGRKLVQEYNIRSAFELTNCSICHR